MRRLIINEIFLYLCTILQFGVFAVSIDSDFLHELDNKVKSKWDKFEENQQDSNWIEDNTKYHFVGPIYQSGFGKIKVSRQIEKDLKSVEYYTIDSINIGQSILEQAGILTGNILLFEHLPFFQIGPHKEVLIFRATKHDNYRDAIIQKPFSASEFPYDANLFSKIEDNIEYAFISTKAITSRINLSMLGLLNIDLPGSFEFGPKAKLTLSFGKKTTIKKKDNGHAVLTFENTSNTYRGIGLGLGLYFDDLINLPVTIGINNQDGYSPFVFNSKSNKAKIKALSYDLDMNDTECQMAYDDFIAHDLTTLQDLVSDSHPCVKIEVLKDQKSKSKETNLGLDLIFFKVATRKIYTEIDSSVHFNSQEAHNYREFISERINDKQSTSGELHKKITFKTIATEDLNSGIYLETSYLRGDTKTFGKEIEKVDDELKELGITRGIPLSVDKKTNYKKMQIEIKTVIRPLDLKDILNSSENDLWIAAAVLFGQDDPKIWENANKRHQYFKRKHIKKNAKELREAKKLVQIFNSISKNVSNIDRAKELVKILSTKKGRELHRLLLQLAGSSKIQGYGRIIGRELY